jgi:hypothetical protein
MSREDGFWPPTCISQCDKNRIATHVRRGQKKQLVWFGGFKK